MDFQQDHESKKNKKFKSLTKHPQYSYIDKDNSTHVQIWDSNYLWKPICHIL